MNLAIAALRLLRGRLHDRAFRLHGSGHAEAAQAIWAVVEELDDLINLIARRRRIQRMWPFPLHLPARFKGGTNG